MSTLHRVDFFLARAVWIAVGAWMLFVGPVYDPVVRRAIVALATVAAGYLLFIFAVYWRHHA
jgi:hypothetical protein